MKKSSIYRLLSTVYFSSGETILEVIIAVAVLMLIMAPASGLFISSTQNIATNRNNLIGASLADEGAEVVRGMRNTNFLRFSPRASDCWNAKLKKDDGADIALSECHEPLNKIAPGFYQLNQDASGTWNLAGHAELHRPALPSGDLGPYDLAGPDDNFYRLLLDNTTHRYNYTAGSSTNFYRQIEIQYFNLDGIDEGGTVDEEGMEVTSTVLFRIGTRVRSLQRVLHITKQSPL